MAQVVGYDSWGTGFRMSAVGDMAEPMAQLPLAVVPLVEGQTASGDVQLRFAVTGDPLIASGTVVYADNGDSIRISTIIYRDADGAPLFVYKALKQDVPVTGGDAAGAAMGAAAGAGVWLGGNDGLAGTAYNDRLAGLDGNDTLYGQGGDDSLLGGDGDDLLKGGAGADRLIGGKGIDTASYTGAAAGVVVNLATGTGSGGEAQGDVLSDIEILAGTAFDDELTGDDADNTFYGGAGRDLIQGGAGDDVIHGQGGQDDIHGGDGDDILIGGDGADSIHGGDGDDRFEGTDGGDWQYGGAGNDVFVSDGTFGRIAGDAGIDTVDFSGALQGVSVGMFVPQYPQVDSLSRVEILIGSAYDDDFQVQGYGVTIHAGDGADKVVLEDAAKNLVYGGAGNDRIQTGDGNDTVYGDAGNDRISSTWGTDRLYGGDGADRIDIFGYREGQMNILDGGDGKDILKVEASSARMSGGAGNDMLIITDPWTFDYYHRSSDMDGGDGADRLVNQNTAHCVMTGGAGADVFEFSQTGKTLVTDWDNEVLRIASTTWSGLDLTAPNAVQDLVLDHARVDGDSVVIGLDDGYGRPLTITLLGVSDIDALAPYIDLSTSLEI